MIINIPLQIADDVIEEKLTKDAERIMAEKIAREIDECLKDKVKYNFNKTVQDGMKAYVEQTIERVIKNDWKDEIIDKAAKDLANKCSRTKKARELKKGEQENG